MVSESRSKTSLPWPEIGRVLLRAFGYLVFWGWNLWFFAWLGMGLAPLLLWPLLVAVSVGMVPLSFALFGLALVGLPLLGMLAGLTPRLRGDPGRLLSLFYGVQAPLMLIISVRMFAVQQLTWPTGLMLAMTLLGGVSLMRTLWSGPEEGGPVRQGLRLFAQTGYALVGLWCAMVAVLYGASLSAAMLLELPDLAWNLMGVGIESVLVLTWLGLFAMSALVMALFPVAMVGISLRSFELVFRASARRLGLAPALVLSSVTAAGWLLAFVMSSDQPQDEAFAWVEGAKTDEARKEALAHREEIREGLLFARLATERTFDGDPEGEHMSELWSPLVGETLSVVPQLGWRALFFPFVYHPVHEGRTWAGRGFGQPQDVTEATAAYGHVFDQPIEVAERETLLAAARQTWNWEDAQAGLLEVGQRKVHLDRQDVVVEPQGDVARVIIHDVYRNHTWDPQEVLLYFSLPETAAITGLWLGPDEQNRFPYVVAPRGAAQEVYERQVQIRRDPALLEQTGPVQYRLRAFPIERRQGEADDVWSITAEGPEMHLWLELAVPVTEDADGAPVFPLPRVNEVRNLFWDEDSERIVNGAPATADGWLPESVAAPGTVRKAHSVRIGERLVTAEPAGPVAPARFHRAAVLVDGTFSMDAHREELDRALQRLRAVSDELELWCTVEQTLARCPDFDAQTALFWGSVALETRLVHLASELGAADVLVVLTDEGSYTLAAEAERGGLPDVELPQTWLVHLGGRFPNAYPDWTADRLQRTGGGVVSSVDELVVRHADASSMDGWRWTVRAAQGDEPVATQDAFTSLAARRLVAQLDAEQRSSGLSALDTMHAVAVSHHVVTPYSSMLVLVDDAQRRELAAAEKREDRFDREITDGQEQVVSAAPEPATWLLLGMGGAGMLVMRMRKKGS
jgi:putative PEP-CTERM system integral membrane protein